jgi:hypothetical protein
MATLCQNALDARKLADKLKRGEIDEMRKIRKSYSVPHWRGGGSVEGKASSTRLSNSILGKLHDEWQKWIDELSRAERQQVDQEFDQHDTDTVVSVERECIVCLAEAERLCFLCDTVWFCSDECGQKHWIEARHNNRGLPSMNVVPEIASEGCTEVPAFAALGASAIDILTDVTFGRARPNYTPERKINYRSLSGGDLLELANLVQVEFLESLRGAIEDEKSTSRSDSPHAFDVFLMNTSFSNRSFSLRGGELAVCRPDGEGLAWFNKDGDFLHLDAVSWDRRVASLSGASRTLENLIVDPVVGSLTHHAMKRTMLVDVLASSSDVNLNSSIASDLNEPQRQVVATVMSPSFQSGFLAVQGPPGTGEYLISPNICFAQLCLTSLSH